MPGMLDKMVGFCSTVKLMVGEDCKNAHEKVIDVILALPPAFDNKKLTLAVEYETRPKLLNLDRVCRALMKQRPNLVFKEFELKRIGRGEEVNSSVYSYGLNQMLVRSANIILKNTFIDLRKFNVTNKQVNLTMLRLENSCFFPPNLKKDQANPIKL